MSNFSGERYQPDTTTYKQSNGGWTSENSTVAMKWESDIEKINKSLEIKRPSPVVKCSCQSCGLIGRGCVSCWKKKCIGCTSACACKGLCSANMHKRDSPYPPLNQ